MIRKLALLALGIAAASLPTRAANTNTHPSPLGQAVSALHLMNDAEFASFLGHLDADMADSKVQLRNVDVKSLGQDPQDSQELERTHTRCLQSLENIREDIQYLSQKQSLKFDLLLLIDLNELARNLDALDQGLMNPGTAGGSSAARKSLDYARAVTGIDAALARRITAFQDHVLAFTGVIDATLDQPQQGPDQSETPK